MGVRHHIRGRIPGLPLVGAGRALGEHPFMAEQVLEVAVVPLDRVVGPGALDAAADLVAALAATEGALPAEALLLDARGLGLAADGGRVTGAVALAEGVAAGDERDGLLVVHRHAGEGLADVTRRRQRVRVAVRALRIHVDQAHLHGRERILQITRVHVAVGRVIGRQHPACLLDPFGAMSIALVAAKPLGLRTPVDVLLRLPDIGSAAAEAEGPEAH